LVSYAAANLQSTCVREEDIIYDGEVDTITCGPADLTFDYSLMRSLEVLRSHYDQDISQAESPPVEGGTCEEGTYEDTYQISGEDAGRLNCRLHTSSTSGLLYRVIEWTNEELLVIGYISNRADLHTWEELLTFWEQQAGPFSLE
jgi:hypothetical protein